MQSFIIPYSILTRVVAVHTAAAERKRLLPVLGGCLFRVEGGQLAIVATDGKILVEEVYPLPDVPGMSIIFAASAIKPLAQFLKVPIKARRDAELILDNGKVSVALHGAVIPVNTVHGTFPPYDVFTPAHNNAKVTDYPSRVGIDTRYLARLDDLWGEAVVLDLRYRGMVFTPLYQTGAKRRALIMPVTLPS